MPIQQVHGKKELALKVQRETLLLMDVGFLLSLLWLRRPPAKASLLVASAKFVDRSDDSLILSQFPKSTNNNSSIERSESQVDMLQASN